MQKRVEKKKQEQEAEEKRLAEKAKRTMASVFVLSAVSTRIDILTNKGSDARPDIMLTDLSKSVEQVCGFAF